MANEKFCKQHHFYPRPPRGGRLTCCRSSSRQCGISIHALREEGDVPNAYSSSSWSHFYPRPPRGGRPHQRCRRNGWQKDFYPRPPRGGRPTEVKTRHDLSKFLSTPSARRATGTNVQQVDDWLISIHALREEGDLLTALNVAGNVAFLSTPSARRATLFSVSGKAAKIYFYPRPPRGGRQKLHQSTSNRKSISIHALREEGDVGGQTE